MNIFLILLIFFGLLTVITSVLVTYKYKDHQDSLFPYFLIGGLELIFVIIAVMYSQMM